MKEYQVFISYSWTTSEHEKWVYELARRLMEHGINVRFDKWDLKPGQDKYKFMESMVQDENIDKVLIICDKGYKEKADKRKGGVGTETQIITPEIYNEVKQEKFVPIIVEIGENFDSYLPHYLKSRIAINMSSDEVYEEGYEKLLRLIYERPQFRKPAKGEPPVFIFEDEKSHYKTKNLNKQLKHFLVNKPKQANLIISDFIEEFKNILNQFQINKDEFVEPYDEIIYNNINDMIGLRNDYIEFLCLLCKTNKMFDIDIIINLFEEIYWYTEDLGGEYYNALQFDHYKFFITELFLYTIAILIENNYFEEIDVLLSTRYFLITKHREMETDFSMFRFYIESLDEYRKRRLKNRRISITADLLIERSKFENKNYQEKIVDADLLLHYISVIKFKNENMHDWFPITYIYKQYSKVDLLKRLINLRHFNKIKILFKINTVEEMKKIFKEFVNPYRGYNGICASIPNITSHVNPDEIGKY